MADDLIVCDLETLGGKPIGRATRISAPRIPQCLASGMTREHILGGDPRLTAEGLDAALDFAPRGPQGGQPTT